MKDTKITLQLGKISGQNDVILREQQALRETLQGVDERMRRIERRAAVHTVLGGGIAGSAMAVFVSHLKSQFGG